jgi:hypothetical protein
MSHGCDPSAFVDRLVLFAENTTMTAVFLGIMVVTISFLLMRTTRYFNRQREMQQTPAESNRPRLERRTPAATAPQELLQWDVRMHETARELMGQIDSKLSALQTLAADADRAAARLEAALRSAGAAAPLGSSTGNQLGNPMGNQAVALQSASERAPQSVFDSSDGAAVERPKDEIYTLADYGYASTDIAHRTGVPVGEVELILSLRGQR